MFDMSELRQTTRRAVDDLAAVPATYRDDSTPADGRPVTVRWITKKALIANEQGGVEVITNVERLVFNSEKLAAPTDFTARGVVTLKRGGTVDMPSSALIFTLEAEESSDGPILRYWQVSRFGSDL